MYVRYFCSNYFFEINEIKRFEGRGKREKRNLRIWVFGYFILCKYNWGYVVISVLDEFCRFYVENRNNGGLEI